MSESPTNRFTKTFYGLTNEPTKSKVYFKEITATQSLESNGCPCTNCRTTQVDKKKKSRAKKK